VANQTLGGEQLTGKSAECMNAEPPRFYLVAPCPRRRTAGVGRAPSRDLSGLAGAHVASPGWGGAWACSTDSVAGPGVLGSADVGKGDRLECLEARPWQQKQPRHEHEWAVRAGMPIGDSSTAMATNTIVLNTAATSA